MTSYCTREVNYARKLEPRALKNTRSALVRGLPRMPLQHEAVPTGDVKSLQEFCGVPVSRSVRSSFLALDHGEVTESGAHVSRIKLAPPDLCHLDLPSQSVLSRCQ